MYFMVSLARGAFALSMPGAAPGIVAVGSAVVASGIKKIVNSRSIHEQVKAPLVEFMSDPNVETLTKLYYADKYYSGKSVFKLTEVQNVLNNNPKLKGHLDTLRGK